MEPLSTPGSWVCVCTKRVCVCDKEPNSCTVGVYSTEESWYLYSIGEYICLLLVDLLKNKLKMHVIYDYILSQHISEIRI